MYDGAWPIGDYTKHWLAENRKGKRGVKGRLRKVRGRRRRRVAAEHAREPDEDQYEAGPTEVNSSPTS